MKIIKLILLLSFVFLLSCREESTLNMATDNPSVENTTTRFKEVRVKYTQTSNNYVTVKNSLQGFFYSSDQKLKGIGSAFSIYPERGLKLTYGNNGKISKVVAEFFHRSFEFYYDSNNRLTTIKEVTEQSINNGRISHITYSNNGDEIRVISLYPNTSGNHYEEEVYTLHNGNLINYKLYDVSVGNFSNLQAEYRLTYDNSINTVGDILDKELMFVSSFGLGATYDSSSISPNYSPNTIYERLGLMSNNNVTKIEARTHQSFQFSVMDTFQYEFDTLNRVSKIKKKYLGADEAVHDYEFVY